MKSLREVANDGSCLSGLYSLSKYRYILCGGIGRGDCHHLNLLNRSSKFWGKHFPHSLHAHYLERTYFQLFSTIILICILCIFCQGTLVYNVISLDTFSYIVSTHFLKRVLGSLPDYWMNIFIIKRLCNFS